MRFDVATVAISCLPSCHRLRLPFGPVLSWLHLCHRRLHRRLCFYFRSHLRRRLRHHRRPFSVGKETRKDFALSWDRANNEPRLFKVAQRSQ